MTGRRGRRVKVVCPNCDALVAVAPVDWRPAGDLICGHCGARLALPTGLEALSEEIREVIATMLDRVRRLVR